MNINQRIAELGPGGLPRYNNKCNELARAVNWLLGMQTSAGPVSDGGRGPIINVPPASAQGPQPWLTDPDGNSTGWMKVLVLNPNQNGPAGNSGWVQWIWTGPTELTGALPWQITPNNNQAGWIVCPKASYWGSGVCPGAAPGNFQPSNMTDTPSNGQSPNIYTGVPRNLVVPPTSGPTFYVTTWDANQNGDGSVSVPGLLLWAVMASDNSTMDMSFHFTIAYEGTEVFSVNGNASFSYPNAQSALFPLNPTGWVYDPSGLPGYAQGSKQWVWQYNGSPTQNQVPQVVQTLTFTYSGGFGGGVSLNASHLIFMSA